MTVPEEAVQAAVKVHPYLEGRVLRRVLEAAAPHIAAAERERIRQLAQHHAATCVVLDGAGDMTGVGAFADLLTEEPTD